MLHLDQKFQDSVAELKSQPRWRTIAAFFFDSAYDGNKSAQLEITSVDFKKGLMSAEITDSKGTLLAKIEDNYSQHDGSRYGMFLTMYKGEAGQEQQASQQHASTNDILAKLKAEFPQYDTSTDTQPAPIGQEQTHG